jgi:hypothetical protein
MLEKTNEVLVESDVFEFHLLESGAESNEGRGSVQAVIDAWEIQRRESGSSSNERLPIISVVGCTELNLKELSDDVVP